MTKTATPKMIEDLRLGAVGIRRWMSEALPANEQGQVHFARALAEAAAEAIEAILPALAASPPPAVELVAVREPWGWVVPRGGKKKPVILARADHEEISAICEEEIHGQGYFPLYTAPPASTDLREENERLKARAEAQKQMDDGAIKDLAQEVTTLSAENNTLREALEPFGKLAHAVLSEAPADADSIGLFRSCDGSSFDISMDEMRAVCAALAREGK